MTTVSPPDSDIPFETTADGTRIIQWPYGIYSGDVGINLMTRNRTGGVSLSGLSQVVGGPVQRWVVSMDMNTLHPKLVREYRATIARAKGRRNIFRMPIRDPRYEVKPRGGGLPGRVALMHSHGAPFSSGAGYSYQGDEARVSVAVGRSTMTVQDHVADYMAKGTYFGINSDLHLCIAVSGNKIEFEPAARRDHNDAAISFRPSLYVRLQDDESGFMRLDQGWFGRPSLRFIEEVL